MNRLNRPGLQPNLQVNEEERKSEICHSMTNVNTFLVDSDHDKDQKQINNQIQRSHCDIYKQQ